MKDVKLNRFTDKVIYLHVFVFAVKLKSEILRIIYVSFHQYQDVIQKSVILNICKPKHMQNEENLTLKQRIFERHEQGFNHWKITHRRYFIQLFWSVRGCRLMVEIFHFVGTCMFLSRG